MTFETHTQHVTYCTSLGDSKALKACQDAKKEAEQKALWGEMKRLGKLGKSPQNDAEQ
jgi:hypothetical protein